MSDPVGQWASSAVRQVTAPGIAPSPGMLGPAGWERYQALSSRDWESPYTAYDRWVWEQAQGRTNPPAAGSPQAGAPQQFWQITDLDRMTYAGLTDDEIRQAKLIEARLAPQATDAPWYAQGLGQPDYQMAQQTAAGLRMTPAEEQTLAQRREEAYLPYLQPTAYQQAALGLERLPYEQMTAYQQAMLGVEQLPYQQMTAYQGAQLGQQQAEAAQRMALAQQQMAFEAQQAQLAREQRQREMAQQIGQAIAAMQAELYQQTLPYRLPQGTQYAPGFEPLGPVSAMYRLGGLPYQPTQIPVANPPTSKAMENWIADAMRRFGPK